MQEDSRRISPDMQRETGRPPVRTDTESQTHRHTDSQSHRYTESQTQTHRVTDTQSHRRTDSQTHRLTDSQTQTHRFTDADAVTSRPLMGPRPRAWRGWPRPRFVRLDHAHDGKTRGASHTTHQHTVSTRGRTKRFFQLENRAQSLQNAKTHTHTPSDTHTHSHRHTQTHTYTRSWKVMCSKL